MANRDNFDKFEDISSDYEDIESNSKPKKKKSLKRRILKVFIIAFLVIALLAVGTVYFLYSKLEHPETSQKHENKYVEQRDLFSDKNVTNILLLGVDARENENPESSRSDTMIILSIDNTHKKIKLTSFLRDSYVKIPGHGEYKLNASCSWGGIDLVWDTLEYNFKIKIDNYMLVNFQAFEELIDAIGGVDVKITEKEAKYLNKTWNKWSLTGSKLNFDSGEAVHLNGEEALMFCRIRKLDSDFMRTDRQRRTISAIKEQMTMLKPSEVINLINNVLPLVETDITSQKMLTLSVSAVSKYLSYDLETCRIPVDGTWKNASTKAGASIVYDVDENASLLYDFIYNDVSPETTTTK